MKMGDPKLDTPENESSPPFERAPSEVAVEAAEHRNPSLTETSGVWAALAAYFAPPLPRASVQRESSPWSEDDFSAEHGYEPGFEGRSEFEHGEFERWV